jgi:hypothetical protein
MILVGVFAAAGTMQETSGNGVFPEGFFPYVVYVVPNALFPLMTYFLWIRLPLYKPYIALYIAGKTIAVVSIIGWAIFSFRPLILSIAAGSMTPYITERPGILIAGITLVLAAADALSIFGGLMLNNKLNRPGARVSEPEGIGKK